MSGRGKGKQRDEHGNHPAKRRDDSIVTGERALSSVIVQREWSGPLPPPDVMARYNDIVPGAAERILGMAENQTSHRIDIEKIAVRGDQTRSFWGLIFGFIISLAVH